MTTNSALKVSGSVVCVCVCVCVCVFVCGWVGGGMRSLGAGVRSEAWGRWWWWWEVKSMGEGGKGGYQLSIITVSKI